MLDDSQLRTFMCDFELRDGQRFSEADFPNGWSDFPHKKEIVAVRLANRIIGPKVTLNLAPSSMKGFAIHWVGRTILGGENNPYMAREIMMVLPTLKAFVYSLNLRSGRWMDYTDNLLHPKTPHLINYDLKKHGMG